MSSRVTELSYFNRKSGKDEQVAIFKEDNKVYLTIKVSELIDILEHKAYIDGNPRECRRPPSKNGGRGYLTVGEVLRSWFSVEE